MNRKILIVTMLALSVVACKNEKKDSDSDEAFANQTEVVAEVDTISLSLQTFSRQILCNGRLSAIRKAELFCPKSGEILQSVHVKNGQYVTAGTLLAVSETRDKSVELDRAHHDLERAKVELQDKLIGLGYDVNLATNSDLSSVVPSDVLKRAEVTSGYYSAKFALQSAQTALADCRLTAPFSGRVADLTARPHQRGDKFCILIDDAYFDVEFRILEAELSFMHVGQMVKVIPFVHEDETYEGLVTEINPTIDDKGLVSVRARIKNHEEKLIDGMNVKIIVENMVPDMFVVPKEAVVERDGYHVVFMYDMNTHRAIWTYVDIAYSNLTSFAITGCAKKSTKIQEGDIVITSGNLNLADDTEVKIIKDE